MKRKQTAVPAGELFSSQPFPAHAVLPLAARMRPRTLDEFVGQEHILAPGKLLRRAIEADRLTSLIFYGPPGIGKTALASVICSLTRSHEEAVNAAAGSVADIRMAIERAKKRHAIDGKRTILFVDELHRFSKAQQDVLMPDVERGNPVLIGATTHNPFFSIVAPLLSRSSIFEFKPLSPEDITRILARALEDTERGLGACRVHAEHAALEHLAVRAEGDARRALNALEVGVLTTPPDPEGNIRFSLAVAEESIQKKIVRYDRQEDEHYDTASAFIKSMRGSDPDATLYWLAKMLCAGEDPRFIIRRIVICASEDVGNADPLALVVAEAALHAFEFLGMPEARIPLAHAAVYVACAPKSNAVYLGIEQAMKDVEQGKTLPVPPALQDGHYAGAQRLGRAEGYRYAHDGKDHYVEQAYIPEFRRYYVPAAIGHEQKIREWLRQLDGKKFSFEDKSV